jgi:hypothetical protein
MDTAVITSVTFPYSQPPAGGDLAVSALVEVGLRAAASGDDALASAQIFALPPHVRAEYRELLAEERERRSGANPRSRAALPGRAAGL